eukprot:781000-Pelagomonas_calceolata.AAC.1
MPLSEQLPLLEQLFMWMSARSAHPDPAVHQRMLETFDRVLRDQRPPGEVEVALRARQYAQTRNE